jgi:NAD(P)H dehydrogenase (quinone)
MKNILIINGHPNPDSLCTALAMSYHNGAVQSGAFSKLVNLYDLHFDPILRYGYRQRTELEPDLVQIQHDILQANHIVFVYPVWWATYPALFKGFIDRVFLPKFAFQYREKSVFWDKLLKGKTASIITTSDTPAWYNWLVYRNAGIHSFKEGVLKFCGIKPLVVKTFGPVKSSSEAKRKTFIDQAHLMGNKQM